MWILTQNGDRILSTEGLVEIRISEPFPGKTDFAVMIKRKMDGKEFALGFYKFKCRAMEILKEIIKEQSVWMQGEGTQDTKNIDRPIYAFVPPKTYVMPKDDENYGM